MRSSARLILASAALGLAVTAAPAAGDPYNDNSIQRTFICNGTPLTITTIDQNNARSGQVVDGDGRVFHVTKVIRDGIVLFAVPGWEDRTDVTCTDPSDPAVTGYGFFSPRT